MSKKSRIALIVASVAICLAGVAIPAFAVDEELMTRYLNAANDQYTAGNYAKAFSYINTVLGSYKQESLPENVEVIAETIYYGYLSQIKDSRDGNAFRAVKEKLIEFPYLSSERVNRLVKIINTFEAQDAAWGGDPTRAVSSGGDSNPVLRSTLELQLALENAKKDAVEQNQRSNDERRKELLETQQSAYREAFEATGSTNRFVVLSLFVLAGVCFIVFVVVVVNTVLNLKNAKNQNDKFVETLRAVSQLSRLPQDALAALPPIYGADGEMRMIGSAQAATGLPPPPTTESEKKELDELARKCRELGAQIDLATGRKNNSKNVSEMVYKIALEMGVAQYDAMLYFSVAMVYDIGFLEIDRALLSAENLTEAQKYEIRNHVKQGLAQLSFVPERYTNIFADGVLTHHENMDGSGYPEGLQGERIPYIGRLIRVVESFVALVSKRSYREIFDKESAVAELEKKPGLYDPAIVAALDRVI